MYGAEARFCAQDGALLDDAPPVAAPPSARERLAALPGSVLDGRYAVEREVGEGGMGVVFAACDRQTNARVAIKALLPSLAGDHTAMARLRREAALAGRLRHPNVCHIITLGETPDGMIYVVMPFVEGEVLVDRTHRRVRLPLDETVAIVRDVAAGLDSAHRLGIVHRDLKPENVMIARDAAGAERAVVMDFGLAKERRVGAAVEKLTATGIVLGTPEFMSPEQLRGQPLDARSDVYALGLMTCEMLTGKLPFSGRSKQDVMIARLRGTPSSLGALHPGGRFSPAVEAAVAKSLSRAAGDRWGSAPEFADALAQAAASG